MKKILVVVGICLLLGGCRPSIQITDSNMHGYNVKIREWYELSDDIYSTHDTEDGYDVIIHFKRKVR